MNNIIPFHYQGHPVRFNGDGWLHASKIAERYGKRLDHWLENVGTLEYVRALDEVISGRESEILDTRKSGYVKTSRARIDRGGGTWLHPKLAVAFARWCDAKFSVWCDLHIDALLRGELTEKQQFDQACKQLEDGRQLASLHGKGLAEWKNRKPMLEHRVDEMRDRLQMVLGLDAPAAMVG